MDKVIFLNENMTNGFNSTALDIFTVLSILCGIFVIISKNPVVSVLFLIGLFLNISVYLMMLGINFIGLSYLLVYVGAVSILFLFILMLINVRISEIVTTTSNSIPLGIIIGILFFSAVYKALPTSKTVVYNNNTNVGGDPLNIVYLTIKDELLKYYNNIFQIINNNFNHFKNIVYISNKTDGSVVTPSSSINISNSYELTHNSLFLTYSQNWDSMLAEVNHINTIGNILYTSYPLWILLTSLILLLAMVGAILITLKN